MYFILGNFVTYDRGIDLSDYTKPRKGVGKRPAKSVEEKEVSVVKLDNLKSLRHNLKL